MGRRLPSSVDLPAEKKEGACRTPRRIGVFLTREKFQTATPAEEEQSRRR
jgi:hypothetical protein